MTETPIGPAGEEAVPPQRETPEREGEGIRFRDNRRIDPTTYEAREPAASPTATASPTTVPVPPGGSPADPDAGPDLPDASTVKVAELTADLQRLSAEYANYRKRVDRDRDLQREVAIAGVMIELLPILDDVGRARDHGELEGGFKAVGESVEAITTKYGVQAYGEPGEPFDPKVHEAMTSESSPDVTEPTVNAVYQVGYRIKDRVLRPARVAVADTE